MQQLSEKDEQYLSRKQELSEIRRAERKEKEKQVKKTSFFTSMIIYTTSQDW